MKTLIKNGLVLINEHIFTRESLTIEDDYILGYGICCAHDEIDASNLHVLPGIIDIHGDALVLVDNIIDSGINIYELNNGISSLCNGTYFLMLQVYNGSIYTTHNKKMFYYK